MDMSKCRQYAVFFFAYAAAQAAGLEWPRFGGPNGNFITDTTKLAEQWPASGPKKLWSRELGEGYSGIAVDGPTLYSMYRRAEQEVTVAISAATGKTLWEHAVTAKFRPGMQMQFGPGPHATPLVTANSVCSVGILANLVCFEKATGKVLWSHDLASEFGASVMDRGFAVSPIAWKSTVIMKVGGSGNAFVAFDQNSGKLLWKKLSFENSPGTPILIRIDGQDQMIATTAEGLVGVNPDNGALLWSHGHSTSFGLNIAPPLWTAGNILIVSSAYTGGARAIELHVVEGKTVVKELWNTNRLRVHHGNLVRVGDIVFGSSGDFGPIPLTAIDVHTGKVLWQNRNLPRAMFLQSGEKIIALDEDGNLSLTRFQPDGLQVLAQASVLANNSWTAPSLAGTLLYARDRRTLIALDLR